MPGRGPAKSRGIADQTDGRADPASLPVIISTGSVRATMVRRRGRLSAKHGRMVDGARETVPRVRHATSAQHSGARSGSGLLTFLVAGLFVRAALISLSLLWSTIKEIQWLLHG